MPSDSPPIAPPPDPEEFEGAVITDLLHPIEILRPNRLEFGGGLVGTVGRRAAEMGITRSLVIAGASNAARASLLGLPARSPSSAR